MKSFPPRWASHPRAPLSLLLLALACSNAEADPVENTSGAANGGDGQGGGSGGPLAGGGSTAGGAGGRVAAGGAEAANFPPWSALAVVDAEQFVLGGVTTSALSTSVYDLGGDLRERASLAFQLKNNFDVNQAHLASLLLDPSDGGFWLTGQTSRPLADLDQVAQIDTYLIKLAADGARVWAKQYDSEQPVAQSSLDFQLLSVDANGYAYGFQQSVHSAVLRSLDTEGETAWSEQVDFDALFYDFFPEYSGVSVPVDGPLRATGSRSGTSYLWGNLAPLQGGGLSQSYLWLLAKVELGEVVWSRVFSEPCEGSSVNGDWIGALGIAPDESAIYTIGPCLTRLDANGEIVWSQKGPDDDPPVVGGVSRTNFSVVTADDGEAVFVTTPNGGSIASSTPTKLIRYDGDGEVVWRLDDVGGGVEYLAVMPDTGQLLYKLTAGGATLATLHVVRRDADTGEELQTLP